MFIFTFFVLIALSQFITNKILNISDSNSVGYTYSKRDSLIIAGFFLGGILLQLLPIKGHNIFWILLGLYAFGLLITMVVLATLKKVILNKQREEILAVFGVLEPVVSNDAKIKNKDTGEYEIKDINNPPFKLGYEGTKINRITIKINPNTFKEQVATNLCLSLNKYLPNYEWVNEFDFAARECSFVGTPLPPHIAKYNGSWLRPTEFIPIGLSGLGEVSWNINSFKNAGRSNYIYEDGKIAKTVDTPSAPQALCVGSPLSLDTIIPTTNGIRTMGDIKVGDKVYTVNNDIADVIELHEIHQSNLLYKLVFESDTNTIIIKSDEIHKWPVLKNNNISLISTNDLVIGDQVIGQSANYKLVSKDIIPNELVRCIKVNSDSHLFLVGDNENGPFLFTRNTGGGKAVYVNQIIELQDI